MNNEVQIMSERGIDNPPIKIRPATEEKQDAIIVLLDSILSSIGGGASSDLISGRKVIASTNVAVAIGSGTCKTIFITALTTNTDVIVVGDENVIYTEATRTGKILYPGDTLTISIDNLSKVFINGISNNGASFSYLRDSE